MEFMVTKSNYYLKENILGTPFFEQCKLSLSWETGVPEVKGTFQRESKGQWTPYDTSLLILKSPRTTNTNIIQLEPNARYYNRSHKSFFKRNDS